MLAYTSQLSTMMAANVIVVLEVFSFMLSVVAVHYKFQYRCMGISASKIYVQIKADLQLLVSQASSSLSLSLG